jgi:hypothetical protein
MFRNGDPGAQLRAGLMVDRTTAEPKDGQGPTMSRTESGDLTDPASGPASPADPQLYVPLRGWLSAKPGRPLLAAAAGLIALQAFVRGWMGLRGWFLIDDLAFIDRASTMAFWSRDYLLESWNGHFMPGAFAVVRVFTDLWPMNHTPVVLASTALQVVVGMVVFLLLRELFGPRRVILVPLMIYLLSPITLPAFLWWAAALNQLPQQLATAAALLLHLRYLRTGRIRLGIYAAATLFGGLLFSEKTLLVFPLIPAMTVFYFTGGPPLARVRNAWLRHWKVWTAYLVVGLGYSGYYLGQVALPSNQGGTSAAGTVAVAFSAFGHALLPGIFGGPWRWFGVGAGGIADPPDAAVLIVGLCTCAVIWVSISFRHRAVFAWLIIAGYALVNVALLAATRASLLGPIIGAEYRYSTDLALILVMFASMAFLPIYGSFKNAEPQLLMARRARSTTSGADRRSIITRTSSARTQLDDSRLVGLVLCLLGASFLYSTVGYDQLWHNNPGKAYFANIQRDIERTRTPITIANEAVPQSKLLFMLYPRNLTSRLFNAYSPRPKYLNPGASTPALYVPDDSGHLRLSRILGFTNQRRPGICGWRVDADPVSIPLERTTLDWLWTIRVDYIATADSTTTMTAGKTTTPVHLRAGLNSIYVMGNGRIASVDFWGLSGGASLCTNDVTVGTPAPIANTHP